MARKYRHIKNYEKEPTEYTEQGHTCEKPEKDLALAEYFFSILKTDCIHRVKLSGYKEVIAQYIHFYNNYLFKPKEN